MNKVFKVDREVQKMSKSKFNVVNPDDICDNYGADTLGFVLGGKERYWISITIFKVFKMQRE